jgi:ABC-type protease/lipase transport system fused ATPase/permease subunit
LNFIKSENLNKVIGMGPFKWIVKNTFFKFFNPKLKLDKKVQKADLDKLREEMTTAEISHFIGFVFVSVFAVIKSFHFNYLFGFIITVVNILMNLYPSLLQQENKRRIDKLIKRIY